MKTLGIGVRVFVGWCPDDQKTSCYDGRLRTGTIVGGPFVPGEIVLDTVTGKCLLIDSDCPFWNVHLDGGGEFAADESILTPIDDDEAELRVTEQSEEVTT